ncbi:MAG TPA: chemotaxis protein CheW [Bryobacteraceae bacterium]|nr:chemotaxis protein CheW [Bryobacteraceae bacterium]
MKEQRRIDWNAARARLAEAQQVLESIDSDSAVRKRTFRARAESLARSDKTAGPEMDGDSIMIFRLARERYALPLASVSEVVTGVEPVPVPGAPARVAGVIQLRGEIKPVFSLAHALGLSESRDSDAATVLLLRHGEGEVGLHVGPVEGVRTVAAGARQAAPEMARHAAWMTADLVLVLNVDALLDEDG